jgi:hypothetical protein
VQNGTISHAGNRKNALPAAFLRKQGAQNHVDLLPLMRAFEVAAAKNPWQ